MSGHRTDDQRDDRREQARKLLSRLEAPKQLVRHGELVEESAKKLTDAIERLGVSVDVDFVRAGALIHDVGKIEFPRELYQAGRDHECAGERLLLANGEEADLARVCRSHSAWDSPENSLEELLVALADKLWKGKRVDDLELRVIDGVADRMSSGRFEIFTHLDAVFERVAANGQRNLERSLEDPI